MRSIHFFLVAGSMSLVGCGDDGDNPTDARVDMSTIDSPGDGPTFKGYEADEGGEVRVEYAMFPNGAIGTRTTAFFWKDPGTTKFFDYINQDGCNDASLKTKWPLATNPIGERQYFDIGPYVILSGGPNPLTVPKRNAMALDPFGRTHPANGWYFEAFNGMPPTDSDGGTFLTEKTLYDVTLPGSAEFPGAFYNDVIYMPAAFALTTPGHTGSMPFSLGSAQTFSWNTPPDPVPTGTEVLSLVAFTGATGPAVICVEPNDGSITVPAAMMDIALNTYPTGGTIARQTLTHTVRELVDANGPTGKRVDFVGVWCYAGTPYTRN